MMLPVDAILPDLLAALERGPNAVLVAQPGAGKTTRVPLALLDAPWRGDGRILVLEPRRLAARAAARRMAETLGEQVGQTVGYRVRLETKVSRATRIEVITDGVFTRLILDDPELSGVSAVLFDEFHERSLDGDLGLALALDVQGALRDDLRIIAMSATINAARVSTLLNEAPVIESKGRAYPVETRYLGRDANARIEDQMARAIFKALDEETGSILAFLPGQAEIRRTAERLDGMLDAETDLAPLYGALTGKEQDAAIRAAPQGRRKVVLATSIAETSLTIEGVRVVVDAGLARVPRFEPATGLTRLETLRAARASVDQRRGRAGRIEPGICYRLWDEAQTAALAAHERPQILEADLAGLALELALWGVGDPAQLSWLDPPPLAAWNEATTLLRELEAIDAAGGITAEGRALARLPLHPRLGHMIRRAADEGHGRLAADIAVLLGERGLGGTSCDLRERLRGLKRDSSRRAKDAKAMAARWLERVGGANERSAGDEEAAGLILARAYPDRLAQARGAHGAFRLANGRGAAVPETEALAREPFLTIAEVQGSAKQARVLLAAPISKQEIETEFATHIKAKDTVAFDPSSGAIIARHQRLLGKLVLSEHPLANPDPELIVTALIDAIRRKGLSTLSWSKDLTRYRARIGYLHGSLGAPWPDVSDTHLTEILEDWLAPYLAGRKALKEITASDLKLALDGLLPWDQRNELDRLAPSHFEAPTGSKVPIDYAADPGPRIAIRVQELFGLNRHPAIAAGRIPLLVELLSPAHRPIQLTQDLPGFWRGSWVDVKAEMKGRYPKHLWPDDPTQATATRRAKPRG